MKGGLSVRHHPEVPLPAGSGRCRHCPYLGLDRPDVCLGCAVSDVASDGGPVLVCPVCEQLTAPDGACANDWCGRGDRWFSLVWAVAPHAGPLRRAITAYKYRNEWMWAEVFARLMVGYLDEHMPWFDDYDVLTTMPAFLGSGARRRWDHIGLMVSAAARLAGPGWTFERDLVVKTAETSPMARLGLGRRRACAEGPLRRALTVPDPAGVAGLRVLVVDDVFTEGSTLREVARVLRRAGAIEVAGLVLARQPWVDPVPGGASQRSKVRRCRPTGSS